MEGSFLKRDFVDVGDGEFVLTAMQDVAPILDANKHDANHAPNCSPSGDLKHVARIPLVVAEFWLNKYGVDVFNVDHAPAVRRLLNDHDWLFLRTGDGVI